MKIKRSGSYYIYQVFNTVVLALVALTCIFSHTACSRHVLKQQQCCNGRTCHLPSGGVFLPLMSI